MVLQAPPSWTAEELRAADAILRELRRLRSGEIKVRRFANGTIDIYRVQQTKEGSYPLPFVEV